MIVITSTFPADVMHPQLTALLEPITPHRPLFIYQHIYSQLLITSSDFQQNQEGCNVLLIRLSDLLSYSPCAKPHTTEQFVTEFVYAVSTALATMQVPLLIFFTPSPLQLQIHDAWYDAMAQQIQQRMSVHRSCCVVQSSDLFALTPHLSLESSVTDSYGAIPYTWEFFNVISAVIAQKYTESIPLLPPVASPIATESEGLIYFNLLGLCKRHGLTLTPKDKSFIELGLDSLRAVLLSADILQIYHCTLSPLLLLSETMTVDHLHQIIRQQLGSSKPKQALLGLAQESPVQQSLSNAQKRLWHAEKVSGGTNRNPVLIRYEIPNHCQIVVLERAFNTVIARHASLRCSVHDAPEEPQLICHSSSTLLFKIIQQTVGDEQELSHYIERFRQKPFDLSQAPLLRIAVVQSPQTTQLLLCIHPIICDIGSLPILCNELSILYHAYANYIDPHLSTIPESYLDVINWQKQFISEPLLSEQKNYWQTLLHELPMMTFIDEKPLKKSENTSVKQSMMFQLSPDVSLRLKEVAATQSMTLYGLLTSAFGLLLSHYTNQDDISFRIAVSGRHHPQLTQIIGFFENELLVRFQISANTTWPQLLNSNKTLLHDIFTHQDLSSQEGLPDTMSNQVGFVFEIHQAATLNLEGVSCKRLFSATHETSLCNLVCYIQEHDTHLSGVFDYNPAVFHAKTIAQLKRAFKTLLQHIALRPTSLAKAIPIFTTEQKLAADHHARQLARQCEKINLNGYQISPSIVEARLKAHPYVTHAWVGLRPSAPSSTNPMHLAAYVYLKNNHHLSEINLHHHLKPHLPKYMIPEIYFQIEHLHLPSDGNITSFLAKQTLQAMTYADYESSQNLLQDQIIAIFAEVLQIDTSLIGINAAFFDLGGTSLSALRLIQMLTDHFHIHVNFSLLYDHATVKLLSEQISHLLSKTAVTISMPQHTLKQIKIGSPEKTPIIFIHPMGGTGCCYLELIKILPDDQPCYIMQDPSIDANQLLFDDLVAMATYYNHLLLKKLSNTPIILAGYAFGGMLALEMVGQLEQKQCSDCVQSIILFDTWIISNSTQANLTAQSLQNKTQNEQQPWMSAYYSQLQDFGMTYRPATINKKIILFKAMQQTGDYAELQDATNYLSLYTTYHVETYPIPCDHDTILQRPQIRKIGQLITQYLQDNIHGMV